MNMDELAQDVRKWQKQRNQERLENLGRVFGPNATVEGKTLDMISSYLEDPDGLFEAVFDWSVRRGFFPRDFLTRAVVELRDDGEIVKIPHDDELPGTRLLTILLSLVLNEYVRKLSKESQVDVLGLVGDRVDALGDADSR